MRDEDDFRYVSISGVDKPVLYINHLMGEPEPDRH